MLRDKNCEIKEIIQKILKLNYVYKRGLGQESHNHICDNICNILENHSFFVQREKCVKREKYIKRGYVDVFATRRELKIGIEFDSHKNVKWKSIEKLVILKPDISIFVVGTGKINEMNHNKIQNIKNMPKETYLLSLNERKYIRIS